MKMPGLASFSLQLSARVLLPIVFSISVSMLPALASANETLALPAAKSSGSSKNDPWWMHAVFYEIYPRSFADSNGDGVGDINGITSKLDYLHSLGIEAIWLTPCYPSAQIDFGYDISDYCNIAPEYGTLTDFDLLVAEAKKRNIRIVMDFVLNHTSDKHPWFVESKSDRTNPKRDWYIWRDGKSDSIPPNNWISIFGHSAWKFDPNTKQFYYHFFYPEQPDLNWRNKYVRTAMYDVLKFWLNRGVAGFRLDAVGCLFEDTQLHDNPVVAGTNSFGDANTEFKYNDHFPEVHGVLKEMRKVLDSYPDNPVLIGETSGSDVAAVAAWYGENLDEIQLPMNFSFAYLNKRSAGDFRKRIAEWDANPNKGWPLYFYSNHDSPRHYGRYGDAKNNDAIAKMMAAMLCTIRGTPLLYYGEEIGMDNNDPKRIEDVFDPIGKLGWPKEKGRDGERTPMQWDAEKFAGFSSVKPWLPVGAGYTTHNVLSETANQSSVLQFYKKLIELRKSEPFRSGKYVPINTDHPNILSFTRLGDRASIVVLNMSDKELRFQPLLSNSHQFDQDNVRTLLTSDDAHSWFADKSNLSVPPYGVYIGEFKQ